MTQSPVAFIAFNRPAQTEKSFQVIRSQRPAKLFLIADGPRDGNRDDISRCHAVREILERIDWPCDVHRNYADVNLGLKARVSTGLDWVFEHVDRAIIMEDDCVAHPDFFRFCDALLERYENEERIGVITGNNFQKGRQRGSASYYFSKYNHCWGWATWRRAWRHYQGDIPFWPEWRQSEAWRQMSPDPVERAYWEKILNSNHRGGIQTWDQPWTACVWHKGLLTATPNVNLVSNIGFGEEATHTVAADSALSNIPVKSLGDITHPSEIVENRRADRFTFDHTFGGIEHRLHRRLLHYPRKALTHWIERSRRFST